MRPVFPPSRGQPGTGGPGFLVERVNLAPHKQLLPNPVQVISAKQKPCGDGEAATGTGGGCHWKFLATTLHAGGSRVMVVWSIPGIDWPFVSSVGD